MLKDPEFIAATILLPKFRRCWTTDEDILKLGLFEEVLIFIYSRGKKTRDHCKIMLLFFSDVIIYRYMLELKKIILHTTANFSPKFQIKYCHL